MFYDVFESLCHSVNKSPFSVAIELGFSRSTPAYWKRAKKPPKREHLRKIAEYFGVSEDYFLEKENAPDNAAQSAKIEQFAIKADEKSWNEVLNRLSRESKIKLFEHAQLLLQVQDLNDVKDK